VLGAIGFIFIMCQVETKIAYGRIAYGRTPTIANMLVGWENRGRGGEHLSLESMQGGNNSRSFVLYATGRFPMSLSHAFGNVLNPRGLRGFRSICNQVGPIVTITRNCSITHIALIAPHGEGQTGSRYVGIWALEGAQRLPLASSEQSRKLSHAYPSWLVPSPYLHD